MHLTEGRNTGFKKIVNALKRNGSPPPVFFTDEERLSFAVIIYQHPEFPERGLGNGAVNDVANDSSSDSISRSSEKSSEKTQSGFGESSEKSSDEVRNKFGENHTKERIMKIMLEKPTSSAKAIAEIIGITPRGVEKSISELRSAGLIERVGPAKGGHWVVKQP